jgi:DNA-binding MarR family transcriptional regulator
MTVPTTFLPAEVTPLRLVTHRLARRLRKHSGAGLTPSQLSALSTLERHGAIRIGQLATREQISKSSVTRLVAKLETLGLVERRPDADDGRSSYVDLTDQGQELLTSSSHRADAYLSRQVAALSQDDQQRLLAALPVLERLLDAKA